MTASTLRRPMTAEDRCDRCGAQAYIRVTMPSGSELLFCVHHGKAHQDKLRDANAAIEDHSFLLKSSEEKPEP